MGMFEHILFDLDGTLTEPQEGITKSVAYALAHFGVEVADLGTLRPFIGPPLYDSFMRFYDFTPEQAELAVAKYRERFSTVGIYENELYPGVHEMLTALVAAGKQLHLATSKPDVFAERVLEHFGLRGYFSSVGGSRLDGGLGTKALVIEHVLAGIGTAALAAVMVGDRSYDVIGATENGLCCIGVLYGHGDRAELEQAGAWRIAADITELTALLLA